jgi:hypothetical protein
MPNHSGATKPGYYWQCNRNPGHWKTFAAACGIGLVKFMYRLAEKNWDQRKLAIKCTDCQKGVMRINYHFPRSANPEQIEVRRIVGLNNKGRTYLPMLWEGKPLNGKDTWFDFKYVGRSDSGKYESYGLSKPAVFKKRELRNLFELYSKIAGVGRFP